jgi:hypothetical protein
VQRQGAAHASRAPVLPAPAQFEVTPNIPFEDAPPEVDLTTATLPLAMVPPATSPT